MIVRPQPVAALRAGPADRPEINPYRYLVQSWIQGTTLNEQMTVAASGQQRDSIQVQSQNDLDGDFLVTRFTSDHTVPYRMQVFRTGGLPQAFMNVPIRVEFVCGYADDPDRVPVPIYVPGREGLEVYVQNLDNTLEGKIRWKAHGERYFTRNAAELAQVRADRYDPRQRPFWLGLDDTTVTLSSGQTQVHRSATVPSDGDFEAEGMWIRSTGPCFIRIAENLGGRPIMTGGGRNQVAVYSEHFGGGSYFYRFPAGPAFFTRFSVLDVQFDNDMEATNTVEIALVGRLLAYPPGNASPAQYLAPPAVGALPPVSITTGQPQGSPFLSAARLLGPR